MDVTEVDFVLTPYCKSRPTTDSGEAQGCRSDPASELEAPPGCVFNYIQVETLDESGQNENGWNWVDKRGKNNDCIFEFSEYVPIIPNNPNFMYPRHLKVYVTGQSHGGLDHIGESAVSNARVWGKFIRYTGLVPEPQKDDYERGYSQGYNDGFKSGFRIKSELIP